MTFPQAIASVFSNYVNFSGRASRPEYWWFFLFMVLVSIVAAIIDAALFGSKNGFGPTSIVLTLATLLPGLAVGIRRLHDIDRTGWWTLIALVPIVGIILLIVWACQEGTRGENRFGKPV